MSKLGVALLLGILFSAAPAYAGGGAGGPVRVAQPDEDEEVDEEDDDRPRRSNWRRRASDDAGDEEDDEAAADDEEDDRPARRTTRKKRPARDADEDEDVATDDEEDDEPPRRKRRARRASREAAAVDDADDSPAGGSTRVVEEVYILPTKLTLALELVGAAPMDGVNSDLFSTGGGAAVGLEYHLSPSLSLHASASYLYFRAGDAMTTTSWASGQLGPRLHLGGKLFGPRTHNRAWVDAHVSYGSSGGIRRPGFDLGAAVQWEVSRALRVGPMARWAFGSDPLDRNAQLVTVGLAVGIGGRSRQTIHIEGDADGDGLIDRLDVCPAEAPGDSPDPEQAGCPLRDQDGDGILDDEDECADEPAGDRPDIDRIGCPLPPIEDRDGDGVPDGDDQCPDQPGAAREGEPTHGCPLARVQDQKIEILEQIFFEHDSATISETSRPVLEAIGKVVGELGDARISIEGHTSETGTDAYNMDLSKRRARAVAQWLIENAGVAATRLDVKGWGKRRPLVSGPGADTSKNRRVEFLILEGK